MTRKLPNDAFQHYLSLGVGRSYQEVADRYGVTKTTVVNRATKEGWQERVAELERLAREQFEDEAKSEIREVRERQLKGARALQSKALQALRDLPVEKAIKAASALGVAWRHELLLMGEATERSANVEEITKREVRELLVADGEDDEAGWAEFCDGDAEGQ